MTDLERWERFSHPADLLHDALPRHARQGPATPSTPSARLLEVTQQLTLTRQMLAEAVAEVKRLRRRLGE